MKENVIIINCKIPEIAKDVDTFYIYATEYIMGSFEEGAPDYAPLGKC